MLDLVMMALVVAAFAGAASYVTACQRIGRYGDPSHEGRE
jgi:hypothetical protein